MRGVDIPMRRLLCKRARSRFARSGTERARQDCPGRWVRRPGNALARRRTRVSCDVQRVDEANSDESATCLSGAVTGAPAAVPAVLPRTSRTFASRTLGIRATNRRFWRWTSHRMTRCRPLRPGGPATPLTVEITGRAGDLAVVDECAPRPCAWESTRMRPLAPAPPTSGLSTRPSGGTSATGDAERTGTTRRGRYRPCPRQLTSPQPNPASRPPDYLGPSFLRCPSP